MSAGGRRWLALALLALAAAVGWWMLGDGDRRRIERRLNSIRELVSKERGEVPILALDKARRVADHFAPEFELRARPYDFVARDRRTLIGGIQRYRGVSDRFEMAILDRALVVDAGSGRATHHLTVEFRRGWQESFDRATYLFQVNWVELDGEWFIDFVDLLEVVQEPSRPLWR